MLIKHFYISLLSSLALMACSETTHSPTDQAETNTQNDNLSANLSTLQLDSLVPLDTMSVGSSNFNLQQAGLSSIISAEYETILYRAYYQTTNYDGQSTPVSGLISVPIEASPTKIISLQSGTNSDREDSPSAPDLFSSYPYSAAFAATGNIFVASDYIGLGQSQVTPTYAHMETTSGAAQDLIDIALDIQKLLSEEQAEIYLVGLSSGAAANVYLQAELEKDLDKYPVVESANISGPYQISKIQSSFALENNNNYFLGYLANSYSEVYDIELSEIIQDSYLDTIPSLYAGNLPSSWIQSALPTTSSSLIQPEIIQSIQAQDDSEFMNALRENDVYDTQLTQPMTLYYSTEDLTVDPMDSQETFNHMESLGNPVSQVNLGNFNHLQGIFNSFPLIVEQFKI